MLETQETSELPCGPLLSLFLLAALLAGFTKRQFDGLARYIRGPTQPVRKLVLFGPWPG